MSKLAPYYSGDPIELKFKVTERGRPVEPSSAFVDLFSNEELFVDAKAEIDKNEVKYIIDGTFTKDSGNYRAVFTVNLPPDIVRSHIIRFNVVRKEPIISKEEDAIIMPLTEESTDFEIGGAIGQAIRMWRRAGHSVMEAAKMSSELAQKMTNRRLP